LTEFSTWLSATAPSVFIQEHNYWAVPGIQSVHIAGVAVVMGSLFLMVLRILGLTWTDQTLRQTVDRFGPALNWTLFALLFTGGLLVVAEPKRELVSFSFWAKMTLVVLGTLIAILFQKTVRKRGETLQPGWGMKALSISVLLLWMAIIFLGRFIAYDHIWGSWSPQTGGA
jgi:hypothetical protein